MIGFNDKFSVINLDLPGRVFHLPTNGRLEVGDLLQMVGKARQFAEPDMEVAIPATGAAPEDSVYVTILRRRRR